jgi:hypothetical protein
VHTVDDLLELSRADKRVRKRVRFVLNAYRRSGRVNVL